MEIWGAAAGNVNDKERLRSPQKSHFIELPMAVVGEEEEVYLGSKGGQERSHTLHGEGRVSGVAGGKRRGKVRGRGR